jgi:hypothetical protein
VHQLFIDFKKAYDSVRREAVYIKRCAQGVGGEARGKEAIGETQT